MFAVFYRKRGHSSSCSSVLLLRSLLWFLTPDQKRAEHWWHSKRDRQMGGVPRCLLCFCYIFRRSCFSSSYFSEASESVKTDVTGKIMATEQIKANLNHNWAAISEVLVLLWAEGVVCMFWGTIISTNHWTKLPAGPTLHPACNGPQKCLK